MKNIILITSLALLLTSHALASGGVVVIVNNSNPIMTMSKKQVKKLFLRKGSSRWSHGVRSKVIDHSNKSAQRNMFLSNVLGMTGGELRRYWTALKYATGRSVADTVGGGAEAVETVARERGAISFVSASLVTGKNAGKVKVVLTIGN